MTEHVMVVCIDCPSLIPKGLGSRRCAPCRTAHNKRKNNTPAAIERRKNRTPGLTGTCACCGIHGRMTKDHIIPLVAGGNSHPSNIQLLCLPCNSSKGVGTECLLHASKRVSTVRCGTNSSYHLGCRCDECKRAHCDYQIEYERRRRGKSSET